MAYRNHKSLGEDSSKKTATYSDTLAESLTQRLRLFSNQGAWRLQTVLLAAFKVLLFRYAFPEAIAVAVPHSSDPGGFKKVLTELSGDMTFSALLDHTAASLESAIQWEPGANDHPCQAMFHFSGDMGRESILFPFAISLTIQESNADFKCIWRYKGAPFDEDFVRGMAGCLGVLLETVSARPNRYLNQIPLLGATEESRLRALGAGPQANFADDKCIHQLFEIQAARTPDHIAVKFENDQLTYRELNHRANRLARHLQTLGVNANGVVGVCLERSLDLILTLLGILKAGGAYMPLDPAYPRARLAFMLENARAPVLVTQSSLGGLFRPNDDLRIVTIDDQWDQIARHDDDNLGVAAGPRGLAYVLYTSGSTGRPKGVACHHSGVVNLLADFENRRPLQPGDHCSLWTVIGFDVSVYEIWSALLAGGCLHIAPDAVRSDPGRFLDWMAARQIDSAYLPPFMLNALAERQTHDPLPLRRLLVGVEPIAESLLVDIQANTPGLCLINGYGPTETTICATLYTVPVQSAHTGPAPIGRPVQNTKVYVLDQFQHPTPQGVPGELYIGGAGVAHGYLNHAELTQERFIPNPWEKDMILYRTGDKVRYRSDGNLCFLGRFDHQVKLRGFRIELGEIANCLKMHPDIIDAVAIVRDDLKAGKGLVAYLVLDENSSFRSAVFETFLAEHLPAYMIPNLFVSLSALPQTPQGKIDRRVLPPPSTADQTQPLSAPRTPTEIQLAEIWSQILKIEPIGREENFFHLGGDSLRASQIMVRVNAAMNVQLSQQILFQYPTIARLARHIESSHRAQGSLAIKHQQPPSGGFPLSDEQEGIWLFEQIMPDTPVFHISLAYRLKGVLDTALLEKSLAAIIGRHDSLRTVFITKDDAPVQRVLAHASFGLDIESLAGSETNQPEKAIEKWVLARACQPFDLEQGPLIRVALLWLSETDWVLSITLHHLISDGWSVGVLIKEINEIYGALESERRPSLRKLALGYNDFVAWQRNQAPGTREKAMAYWQTQLRDAPVKLNWPFVSKPLDDTQKTYYQGAHFPIALSREQSQKIKKMAKDLGVTLFIFFLTLYKILLFRVTGQTDLMVWTANANRGQTEFEPLIGLFMNTLALRTELAGNPSFGSLIERVTKTVVDAFAHSETPFRKMAEIILPANQRWSPIRVIFLMQTMNIPEIRLPHIEVIELDVDMGKANMDLRLELFDKAEGVKGWFEYNTHIFDANAIRFVAEYFQTIVQAVVAGGDTRIDELPRFDPLHHFGAATLIDSRTGAKRDGEINTIGDADVESNKKRVENNYRQLLTEWNNTRVDYPRNQNIPQLFQAQVEKTPGAAAIWFGNKKLTYRELNRKANQLAHYLREMGVDSHALVGICLPPSLELIVGLLGVLKANSVYTPLDPDYPRERLAFMVEDSRVHVILALDSLRDAIPLQGTPLIRLDKDKDAIEKRSRANPHAPAKANELAYVIYTSGSTGRPKAVLGTVRGVLNRLHWGWETMPFEADEVCCQKTSINFVDHVAEIFSPLLKGIPLVVVPEKLRGDILELMNLLGEHKVTRMVLVPSLLKTILENTSRDLELFKNIRCVICSGEALPLTLAEAFHQRFRSARLFNLYGSSEVAADVTYFEVKWPLKDNGKDAWEDANAPANTTIPIGKPISNTQIYILDKHGHPLPPGAVGELYVGGDGLARGYLNQPELTQKAFIHNPLAPNNQGNGTAKQDERLFRTGDLGRWLPDGNIEFHGRVDHQVKLRGFRIELGEVEAVLSQHDAVREAVVLLYEKEANPFLAAYITKTEDSPTQDAVLISELRAWLPKRLPDYMVPARFTVLGQLPLTPNGKIDREALPDPKRIHPKEKPINKTPEIPLEWKLIKIWEQVLKIDFIGVHDNFFELGGNSLAAIKVLNQVGQTFHKKLPPVTLYQAPTVAQFASILARQNFKAQWRMIEPVQIHGPRPPFFFFGSIERARALAPLLGADQPFFRINVLGFDHKAHSSIKLNDIAKQARTEIGMIQPEGPYYFGAFCNNAVLAVEIARLLDEDRQRVAFMGIFDLFWRRRSSWWEVNRHYYNLSNFGFRYAVEKIKIRVQKYRERAFVNRLKRQAAINRRLGDPSPPELANIELFEKIDATFNKSAFKPFKGRITHFKASEWRGPQSPFLDKIASDGVEVHIVNGCHDNLFFEPQVIQMARQLKVCVDSIQMEHY